jgi:murein DD-endopeptidase MepM/ murein hydrolase activator NlpD
MASSKVGDVVERWVGRIRRRYSVMVHSDGGSGLRHFSLPGVIFPVVALGGLVLLGVGSAAMIGWMRTGLQVARVAELRQENERLAGQIADIRRTVEIFEARMAETAEMEQELRNLANLEPIPDDVRRLGVGGPPPLSELADEASPSPLVKVAREALNRIDELNRQAVFQNANFEEMITTLRDSQEELDHLPSISPVRRGWISSRYGSRKDPFTGRMVLHKGLDVSAWTGTPVYATAAGRVTEAGRNGTLGLLVEIDHGTGVVTRYGHNSRLVVKAGQRVERGDLIAEVGSTGRSTSPHCHYEVLVNGRHVNPWRYILDGGARVKNEA